MRTMLMSMILAMLVAGAAAPALASEQDREGGNDRAIGAGDTGAPQVNVGVVAGSDEQGPAISDRYEKN